MKESNGYVGSVIRQYREERGLTLTELSAKTGLSISYMSEIEKGKKNPSLKALDKIAGALNISRGALVPSTVGTRKDEIKLGDKIRLVRQERKLTLKEVSEKTGLSLSYLSEVERNNIQPGIDALRKLAETLNIPITSLFEQANSALGHKIKVLRTNLGLTQAELGARAGLSASLIAQLENGKVQPSLSTVEKIAPVLGVSPCYLVIETPGLEDLMRAMNPELRQLLIDPNVHIVLRMVCNFSPKEMRFLLNFIQLFKESNLK